MVWKGTILFNKPSVWRGPVRSRVMTSEQSHGRARNAATPGGKPEAAESDKAVMRVGRESRRRAGPDGPDATVVGDTFKASPGQGRAKEPDEKRPGARPPNE